MGGIVSCDFLDCGAKVCDEGLLIVGVCGKLITEALGGWLANDDELKDGRKAADDAVDAKSVRREHEVGPVGGGKNVVAELSNEVELALDSTGVAG